MNVILPQAINLATTNVADDATALWSATTDYSAGATVKIIEGLTLPESRIMATSLVMKAAGITRIYKSLRGGNVGRFPPDNLEPTVETSTSATSMEAVTGIKNLTTQANKSYVAGQVVKIAKTVTPRTVNMTAEIISYTIGTGAMQVSVYSVSGEGTHAEWTITTEDEIGFWEEVGAINRYKMFDGFVETQTSVEGSIEVKMIVTKVDYVALFNIESSKVTITLYDDLESVVLWERVFDLVYGNLLIASISDWYEYFFGANDVVNDIGTPIDVTTFSGVLKIVMEPTGLTTKCGAVLTGRSMKLGDTLYGVTASMKDYSVITTDDAGVTQVEQGYWAKTAKFPLRVEKANADMVFKTLAMLRAVPTAWLGNNDGTSFESLVLFGILREFEIEFETSNTVGCTIEVEGLI